VNLADDWIVAHVCRFYLRSGGRCVHDTTARGRAHYTTGSHAFASNRRIDAFWAGAYARRVKSPTCADTSRLFHDSPNLWVGDRAGVQDAGQSFALIARWCLS
jgi:hypothetical protein